MLMKWLLRLCALGLWMGFFILPVHAIEDAIIRAFTIDLTIDENGRVEVHQELDVEFFVPSRGIYAFIPQTYDMTWSIDGNDLQRSYYIPVRNVNVLDEPYLVETDAFDNVLIRIGDPEVSFTGLKTYTYSYTMQLRDLDLDGRQFIYLNLVGDGWELPIELVNFSIRFPKRFDADPIFYQGRFGSTDLAELNSTLKDLSLSGTLSTGLNPHEALTLFVDVDDDYFTFILPPNLSWLWLSLSLALSGLIIFLFKRYGQDDKAVDTVEFNPIDGLSSAQAGYIYDGSVEVKDVLSLMIEWAHKGYMKIVDDEDKGFTLVKLRDPDDADIRAEKILFEQLFDQRSEVRESDLKYRFYTSLQHAQNGIQSHFAMHKTRRIYSRTASLIKALLALIHLIPLALMIYTMHLRISFRSDTSLVYAALFWAFGSALSLAFIVLIKRWPSLKLFSRSSLVFVLGLLSSIFGLVYYVLSVTIDLTILQFFLSLILMSLNIGFISVMDKRTPLGTHYYGRILGLKRFIESAEKEKLELLVEEDPSYFYKILPYAYVLNVSDVWSKRFESIAIQAPDWYVSSQRFNTLIFMRSMNHTLASLRSAMTSVPRSSGRGGGSFSGGGGGFSGGGFGGGGGGRW